MRCVWCGEETPVARGPGGLASSGWECGSCGGLSWPDWCGSRRYMAGGGGEPSTASGTKVPLGLLYVSLGREEAL